ncbi:glycosyltransferase family 2 protein [Ectothiorhodospiraceae bacterium BW-2]|nr:glycosyltransferase family 2 protein [Ectothiorhodospiraceae bacterium BW-2]
MALPESLPQLKKRVVISRIRTLALIHRPLLTIAATQADFVTAWQRLWPQLEYADQCYFAALIRRDNLPYSEQQRGVEATAPQSGFTASGTVSTDAHLQRHTELIVSALWGGLSRPAIDGLERLLNNITAPQEYRFRAGLELARWCSFQQQWSQLLEYGQRLVTLGQTWAESKEVALLFAYGYTELQQRQRALKWVEGYRQRHPDDSDLRLVLVTLQQHEDLKLQQLNQLLQRHQLVPVQKKDRQQPLGLHNLTATAHAVDSPYCISVIMPVHNGADRIITAISAVLQQSWRNLELIVVDDNSSDATVAVVQQLAAHDSRLKLIQLKQNSGPYVARNRALALAKGDFITTHDSDDWSHPQKLQRQMEQLLHNDQLQAVGSYWVRVDSQLNFRHNWRLNPTLIHQSYVSLIYRRSALQQLGGWDSVRVSADSELLRRLCHLAGEGTVAFIEPQLPLAFALDSDNSLTRSQITHVRTLWFGLRYIYRQNQSYWHCQADSLSLDPKLNDRPFKVPRLLLGDQAKFKLELLLIADYRQPLPPDLQQALQSLPPETPIGLLHWPELSQPEQPFDYDYFYLLQQRSVEPVVHGQRLAVNRVWIAGLALLQYQVDHTPDMESAKSVTIWSGGVMADIAQWQALMVTCQYCFKLAPQFA